MDYFEYPSTVAMLLREIRYGINLGLMNITIDILHDPSPRPRPHQRPCQ